jgi:hypothetical protein
MGTYLSCIYLNEEDTEGPNAKYGEYKEIVKTRELWRISKTKQKETSQLEVCGKAINSLGKYFQQTSIGTISVNLDSSEENLEEIYEILEKIEGSR